MARIECNEHDWDEGIMLDESGRVIEGTMSNLFAWYGDKLLTPIIDRAGIRGICRDVVIERASAVGIGTEECELDISDLLESDGMFVCNSLIGIWPVRRLLDRNYDITRNTRMLQQRLQEAMCSPD